MLFRSSFQLFDVTTGEPHLYCSGSRAGRQCLSRPERDPRELHLRTATAVHLLHPTLIAYGVAAILLSFVALGKAESPASISSVGRTTPECAARDLKAIEFIEKQGETAGLPAARLVELSLMQLQARRVCLAGQETKALAIYDDILSAIRTADRGRP